MEVLFKELPPSALPLLSAVSVFKASDKVSSLGADQTFRETEGWVEVAVPVGCAFIRLFLVRNLKEEWAYEDRPASFFLTFLAGYLGAIYACPTRLEG